MEANAEAFTRLSCADPVLIDVRPAGEVVPGMTEATILTSGAPLPWEAYHGGQRRAVLAAAVYEELAADLDEAGTTRSAAASTSWPARWGRCWGRPCAGWAASPWCRSSGGPCTWATSCTAATPRPPCC